MHEMLPQRPKSNKCFARKGKILCWGLVKTQQNSKDLELGTEKLVHAPSVIGHNILWQESWIYKHCFQRSLTGFFSLSWTLPIAQHF